MSNYIDIIKAINTISKNKVYELRKGKVFITNKKIYKKEQINIVKLRILLKIQRKKQIILKNAPNYSIMTDLKKN